MNKLEEGQVTRFQGQFGFVRPSSMRKGESNVMIHIMQCREFDPDKNLITDIQLTQRPMKGDTVVFYRDRYAPDQNRPRASQWSLAQAKKEVGPVTVIKSPQEPFVVMAEQVCHEPKQFFRSDEDEEQELERLAMMVGGRNGGKRSRVHY